MTSPAVARQIRKVVREQALEGLYEYRSAQNPDTATRKIEPETNQHGRKVTIPQSRTFTRATKDTSVTVIKKIWGTVVFVGDLIADSFVGLGKFLAFYLTPEVAIIVNVGLLGVRAFAKTWIAFRPKSDNAKKLNDWARPWGLLESYGRTLIPLMPLALLPSWLMQPLHAESYGDMYTAHAIRKDRYYDEIARTYTDSKFAKDYRSYRDAQLADLERRVEQARAEAKAVPSVSVPPSQMTEEEFRTWKVQQGWTQVSPKVKLFEADYVNGMDITTMDRAFPHVQAKEMFVDEWGNFWAIPWEGRPLFTFAEESRKEPVASSNPAPEVTPAKPSPVEEELRLLNTESIGWAEITDDKARAERSRQYGAQHAVVTARLSLDNVMDDAKVERNRAIVRDVAKHEKSLYTHYAVQGYEKAVKRIRAAVLAEREAAEKDGAAQAA